MENISYKRNAQTVNKKYTEYFLPTVLTAMATNIAMIVDSVVAGQMLGGKALGAINLLSPINQLYFSLTILFGLGASTIISIAKGKRNHSYANIVFTTAFITTMILSVILICVQLPFADGICSLLTKNNELHTLLYQYYIPFIIGTPLNLLLLCSAYFIRTDGRPKFASQIIIVANVVNLIMDFVYMGFFKMGIGGSSLATVTGYAVGFIMMCTHFINKKSTLKFDFSIIKSPKKYFKIFSSLVTIGMSGALGTLLITVKMLFLNTIIQSLGGSSGMISYSVCSSSQIFMSMFITGASQTMIPIIGVCLGEKDFDGVKFAFKRAFFVLAISSAVIVLFIEAAPELIIQLFIKTPSEVLNAVVPMRINALSFPGLAFSFLLMYYYMATQRKAISTTISIVNGIVILIPSALILGNLFGLNGIWISLVISQIGTLIVIYFISLFKKKRSIGKYKDFYLLESSDDSEILSMSFMGTKENASGVSTYLTAFLNSNGIEKSKANKIALAVEETVADIEIRTKGKLRSDIDVRILINKDETIISIRDNSVEYNPLEHIEEEKAGTEITGLKLISSLSKNIAYSRVLGFNRTIITI